LSEAALIRGQCAGGRCQRDQIVRLMSGLAGEATTPRPIPLRKSANSIWWTGGPPKSRYAPGEKALVRDNYGVRPRTPRTTAKPSSGLESPSGESGERDLVASILRNDRKAAARFVAGHIDAVYAYARHRLAPHADLVDDVVQDVFLAALKGLAAFEGQSSLRTWLLAIARHKIEDVYRQRLRSALALDLDSTEDEPASNDIPLDEQIDHARAGARTRRILERMPERYALILLWRYWEQRSTREVAAAIGTTEKSVERLLARARSQFKEFWLKE
jgi:RNA polymerase sigma-70 factor (ECF subfamily)